MQTAVAPLEQKTLPIVELVFRGRAVVFLTLALAVLAVVLQGYHPFSEDGGLYLAGVKYLLHPELYPASAAFVSAHLHYSLFAPLVAGVVRLTGLSLEWIALALHLLCTWATLLAMWTAARECFVRQEQRWGAVLLCAVWLGLPVAGTSLSIADPYLTARSVSTPCTLLALAACLHLLLRRGRERREVWARAALGLLAILTGGLFHPLMAGYGLACVLTLLVLRGEATGPQWLRYALLLAGALLAAILVQRLSAADTVDARVAAATRTYWFLTQWRWFEWLGLAAPMGLLGVAWRRSGSAGVRALAQMGLVAGALALIVSVGFARAGDATLAVARLQPLRLFHVLYLVLTLVLGGWMGGTLLERRPWRWAVAVVVLAGSMVPAGMALCTSSPWIELPVPASSIFSAARRNPWVAAFVWVRGKTAPDAIVALDANYISLPGEDAQGFRAIAERSSLPDYSKDGGEAAITPRLGGAWARGVAAQTELSTVDDATRRARLLPFHVEWMVLESRARTRMSCPYNNGRVKVCRLS